MMLSLAAGWALARYLFEIPFSIPWLELAGLAAGMVLLTVATGIWNSLDRYGQTPLEMLRSEQ